MKKIVMIIPDQVKIINESSSNIYSKYYDVTEDLIIQMFSRKTDYHENIFLKILKIFRLNLLRM